MSESERLGAKIGAHIADEERVPFAIRRDIKATVERFRHERMTLAVLNVDLDKAGRRMVDHDIVLGWLYAIRPHLDGEHRTQGPLRCSTCTLLAYLCMAFMNPNSDSRYGPLLRWLLGWALAAVVWVFVFHQTSGLLQSTAEVNDLGDSYLVAIAAGVVGAALIATTLFVREVVGHVPHDVPPFWPLWIDRRGSATERRRHLRFTADQLLQRHRPVEVHGPALSPMRAALILGLVVRRLR